MSERTGEMADPVNGVAERFNAVARSWVGTPFVPHSCKRGAGVDCVRLCLAIYQEMGFMQGASFPTYAIDGGMHQRESIVDTWIRGTGEFEQVGILQRSVGDVVTFRFGRVAHHAGIVLGLNDFVHSLKKHGVIVSRLDDPSWRDRVIACWHLQALPVVPLMRLVDLPQTDLWELRHGGARYGV